MLSKIKQRANREEGFTIIEVLIVLAIAGLIMLIVFLAVPALQRNSRNTQRKNDISRLSGAVQEFTNNNNGTVPGASTGNTNGSDAQTVYNNAGTLAYYKTAGNFSVATSAPAQSAGNNGTTVDTVIAVEGSSCAATGGLAATGTARQVALLYSVESSSGGAVPQCTSL